MSHLLIELMDLYVADGRPINGPGALLKWMEVNTALLPAAWFQCVFITCKAIIHAHTHIEIHSLDAFSLLHTHTIITFNMPNHKSHQLRRPNDSISPSFQQLRQQIIKDHYLPSSRWTAISCHSVFYLSSPTRSLSLLFRSPPLVTRPCQLQ